MYLSDRHRVEICLPTQMMLACAIAGISEENQQQEDFKSFKADLVKASWEAVEDLAVNKTRSVLNRVMKLNQAMADEFLKDDKDNIPKLALIQFHCIRFIIEDEYLQYEEDSPFGRGVVTFMNAIDHHAAEEKLNASAIKQARKMLKRLQQMGYYPGVQPNE